MHYMMNTAPNTWAVGYFTPAMDRSQPVPNGRGAPKTTRIPAQFMALILVRNFESAAKMVNYLNGGGADVTELMPKEAPLPTPEEVTTGFATTEPIEDTDPNYPVAV